MKSPQKATTNPSINTQDNSLREKIQRRLDIHECTGRCVDYILELVTQREKEAYLKGIQDANKREMQRILTRKRKEVQND